MWLCVPFVSPAMLPVPLACQRIAEVREVRRFCGRNWNLRAAECGNGRKQQAKVCGGSQRFAFFGLSIR
jgi:hypothetical protein